MTRGAQCLSATLFLDRFWGRSFVGFDSLGLRTGLAHTLWTAFNLRHVLSLLVGGYKVCVWA